MPHDDDIFQTRWEMLRLTSVYAYQPHAEIPDEYGDTMHEIKCKVIPAARPQVKYTTLFEEALQDGWEPIQIKPKVPSPYGSRQTVWFKRQYEEFILGEP